MLCYAITYIKFIRELIHCNWGSLRCRPLDGRMISTTAIPRFALRASRGGNNNNNRLIINTFVFCRASSYAKLYTDLTDDPEWHLRSSVGHPVSDRLYTVTQHIHTVSVLRWEVVFALGAKQGVLYYANYRDTSWSPEHGHERSSHRCTSQAVVNRAVLR